MTNQIRTDLPFAIVPEWLLEVEDLSAVAVRLYAVLDRFADSGGRSFPSRRALAEKLHVKSVDTVDRAMKELVAAGAVSVTKRFDDAGDPTSSLYTVHRTPPEKVAARERPPSRTDAATQPQESGDGGRTDAALNQSHLKKTPPTPHDSVAGGANQADTTTTPPLHIVAETDDGCPRHGHRPQTGCRGCGTTPRQLEQAKQRAAAERRRQRDLAATAAARAEKQTAVDSNNDDVQQLLHKTRTAIRSATQ